MKNGSNIEVWRGEIIIADSFSADGAPHGIAPRVYCAANPLRFTDPSGMGWIQNTESKDIVWRDDVTDSKTTPEGYKFVGNDNMSILKFVGINQSKFKKSDSTFGFTASLMPLYILPTGNAWEYYCGFEPVVISDKNEMSKDNMSGKKFQGIKFFVIFNQKILTVDPTLSIIHLGCIVIQINGKECLFRLEFDNNCFNKPGWLAQSRQLFIPTESMKLDRGVLIKKVNEGVYNNNNVIIIYNSQAVCDINQNLKL